MLGRVSLATVLAAAALLLPAPAHAAGRVSVTNDRGGQVVDATYATTLTVRGSGFQSIRGGHGGLYVWFGTTSGTWQPSRGGISGENYLYVPDSESRENAGYQRYVAYPGSDTASSANGGTMSKDGDWSVDLTVPGAVFDAVGRNGKVRTVDCRQVTCGVITIGAHGVKNPRNETFTPVEVGTLYDEQPAGATPSAAPSAPSGSAGSSASSGPSSAGQSAAPEAAPSARATPPAGSGAPALEVDRVSAKAGHALAFTGSGLPAGRQVTVVFDDGRAASGPFLVGSDGGIAGVVLIPADTRTGTHELRVFGVEPAPAVNFAVAAAEDPVPASSATGEQDDDGRAAAVFAAASALVLLGVLGRLLWRLRRSRRAPA